MVTLLKTAFNLADSSFEFVVTHALHADSSEIFKTARLHGLAAATLSDEEPAFAGVAAIVIVILAVGDDAFVVVKFEGFVALETGVVSLFELASQH